MDQENIENGMKEVQVLPSCDDEHGGVIVEMEEPMDPNDFSVILRCSLSQWKLQVFMEFTSIYPWYHCVHTVPKRLQRLFVWSKIC